MFSLKTNGLLVFGLTLLVGVFCGCSNPAQAKDDPDKDADSKAHPIIRGEFLPGTDLAAETDLEVWFQNTFFKNVIKILISLGAALSVIFLILAGYQYLTALGNEEQVKQAHKNFTFALVGLGVVLLAFLIIQILTNISFETKT